MKDNIKFTNIVTVEHVRDGVVLSRQEKRNIVTNAGFDFVCATLGDSKLDSAKYIALTSNATAPAAGDTTLTSEYTDSGLARALGTYAHTGGTKTYTLAKTFTATADSKTVSKSSLFNAATGGTMFAEALLDSAVTMMTNDQLTVTWTVTLS